MPAPGEDAPHDGVLNRQTCVLLVVDMVESVQLMQSDEARTIACWLRFVDQVRQQVLPATGGTLVKSLGDGLLLRFAGLSEALQTVRRLMGLAEELRAQLPGFWLRAALHVGEVVITGLDVLGQAINLTARLCTLASPGSCVVSDPVRDSLRDGWDGQLHDLGECYLKHYERPVRAWRLVLDRDAVPSVPTLPPDDRWQARLLFALDPGLAPAWHGLGRLLVAELSAVAAQAPGCRVISPLSAARLQHSEEAVSLQLADLLVSVQVRAADGGLHVHLHARRGHDGALLAEVGQRWQDRSDGQIDPTAVLALWQGLASALGQQAGDLLQHCALTHLPSYLLMLAAVQQVHAMQAPTVARAQSALQHLAERHPRAAVLPYWLGKAEFLGIVQHWQPDVPQAQQRALAHLQRAAELGPGQGAAQALALHLRRAIAHQPGVQAANLRALAQRQPNEPLAWLFLSGALSHGQPSGASEACDAAGRAWALSPIDPMDYFFLTFAAAAHTAHDDFATAHRLAARAVRLNGLHLPGLLQLIVAQWHDGHTAAARATAQRYLQLRPQASVSTFLRGHANPDDPRTRRDAEALRGAGLSY